MVTVTRVTVTRVTVTRVTVARVTVTRVTVTRVTGHRVTGKNIRIQNPQEALRRRLFTVVTEKRDTVKNEPVGPNMGVGGGTVSPLLESP